MEAEYTEEDIQSLDWREHIRLRPGMYIGGTDEKAWHHLPIEIMDNSIDEAVAGFAKKITVTSKKGGICRLKYFNAGKYDVAVIGAVVEQLAINRPAANTKNNFFIVV